MNMSMDSALQEAILNADNMPTVATAKQVVEIAKAFLNSANLTFYSITKTILQEDKWIVEGRTFGLQFVVTVDKNTGEVTEYTSEKPTTSLPQEQTGQIITGLLNIQQKS